MCTYGKAITTVHIYKSLRQLAALRRGKVILRCAIGLGPFPEGHKQHEGDGRTPEGTYHVCTRNEQSRYTLFLGLDYPSLRDARRAYRHGGITADVHHAIRDAHALALRPPWDTPLGGEIGIHGGGVPTDSGLADTTAGCIALADEDIRTLWETAISGTKVIIHP